MGGRAPGRPLAARDEAFMRRALALAARGLGETNPNPAVGCVVVRDGRVVGEGFHARAGSPHAEVVALRQAGSRARGATLYVTLEPCAHHGRTPPCAPLVRDRGHRARRRRDPRPVPACARPRPRAAARGRGGGGRRRSRGRGRAAERTLPDRGPPRPSVRPAQGRDDARRAHRDRLGPLEVDHERLAAAPGAVAAPAARRRGRRHRHGARRRPAAAARAAHRDGRSRASSSTRACACRRRRAWCAPRRRERPSWS